MKKIIFFILWVLTVCLVFSISNDHFYIRFKKQTDSYSYRGNPVPAKEENIELWFSAPMMTCIKGEMTYIVDLHKDLMILANSQHKTYVETTLPLNLPSILSDLSGLRWETSQQTTGHVEKSSEIRVIGKYSCTRFNVKKKGNEQSETTLWVTTQAPFDLEIFNKAMNCLRRFLNYNYSDKLNTGLEKINGLPVFSEEYRQWRGIEIHSTCQLMEISKKAPPAQVHSLPANYLRKDKISYQELTAASPGPKKRELSKEEKEIKTFLRKFQAGYTRRDPSVVETWVKDLFCLDAYIIGTNATYPGSFEWRSGHDAAFEMFANDWRRWGDIKMYIDDSDILIEKNAAWVSLFAAVTVKIDDPKDRRSPEASRRRSLARIKDMTESEESSILALYEIIHDASMTLVQYERGHEFIWPIRMTFGMVQQKGKWLCKHLHWSFPGRGFPAVRLLKNK